MKRIKQLSKHLINQIAAGEVIERPASIIKELVENSIDAMATKIEIDISNECRNIRVSDNGCGINPEDIELAFSKHATSKIEDENDLWSISTLGFRGEALSSIISIAKLSCTTRTKDFDYGTRVECVDSEVKYSKAGCSIGTTMDVQELFYNTPVRLKFMKAAKTEFSYIAEITQAMAISNPKVSIVLKNNSVTVLKTSGSGDLLTVLSEIYSPDIINRLKEIKKSDKLSKIEITGYASTPDYTRSSKKSIYVFINNRVVKCPIILKAVDTVYKNKIAHGKYPFAVINFKIPPSEIDINVHPQKREVRYKNTNQIFSFIHSAVDGAISNFFDDNFVQSHENSNILPFAPSALKDEDEIFISEKVFSQIENRSKSPQNFEHNSNQISFDIKSSNICPVADIEVDLPQENKPENIIGQLKNTFILIETQDGLEIVDQHIADERYFYEKLKSEKNASAQLLLISDVIALEPVDIELIEENSAKLQQFGYKIEKIHSKNEIIFRKVPQIIAHIAPKDILDDLLSNIKGDLDNLEENIIITTACKASVKAGQSLHPWQMQELISKWRRTKNPHTCPHGRPISRIIPTKEISKFFQRTFLS